MIHRTGQPPLDDKIVWDYEWFEHCNVPDYTNTKLPAKVLKAQEQAWHACNAAALKYKAAFTSEVQTPDWIHVAAAAKGMGDLSDLEHNTGKSWNPVLTQIEEEALALKKQEDDAAAQKQKMLQIAIVGGVAVVVLGVAMFAGRR